MASHSHHVAILGCGVIGLSTALAILEEQGENARGTKTFVSIVSKEVPDMEDGFQEASEKRHSAEYASVWAGAHHVSDAKTERELRHDKVTFERMSKLARERPWSQPAASSSTFAMAPLAPLPAGQSSNGMQGSAEPLVWVHQTELYERADGSKSTTRPPYEGVLDWYPDFKAIPSSSLANSHAWGCTFSTIDINVPLYHKWLLQRFLELGGRLIVAEAKSLQQAVHLASSPPSSSVVHQSSLDWQSAGKVDVLVASPGLGARYIQGIADQAVHPQRGQVVLVHAPWLSTDSLPAWSPPPRHKLPGYSVVRPQGGREVYVIPRGDGSVVCGGTRIVDDWDPNPRPETTRRILERCLELVPQLVDPKKRTGLVKPRVEDVKVLAVNVGLRPARSGGVRLEMADEDVNGVQIVYNYGYGGAGYQASWGAALDAKELVEQALGRKTANASSMLPSAKM